MGNGFAHHFTKSIFCQLVHAGSHHNVIVFLSSKNRGTGNSQTLVSYVEAIHPSFGWALYILNIDDVMGVILIVGFGTT